MNESQERKITAHDTTKKTIVFTRVRGARKPYMTPTLVKLGEVAKLTNVSVIV